MVNEVESYFKRRRSKLRVSLDDNDIAKKFAKILQRGHLKKKVRFLTDRDGGHVLSPKDIDYKSNQTVKDILRDNILRCGMSTRTLSKNMINSLNSKML